MQRAQHALLAPRARHAPVRRSPSGELRTGRILTAPSWCAPQARWTRPRSGARWPSSTHSRWTPSSRRPSRAWCGGARCSGAGDQLGWRWGPAAAQPRPRALACSDRCVPAFSASACERSPRTARWAPHPPLVAASRQADRRLLAPNPSSPPLGRSAASLCWSRPTLARARRWSLSTRSRWRSGTSSASFTRHPSRRGRGGGKAGRGSPLLRSRGAALMRVRPKSRRRRQRPCRRQGAVGGGARGGRSSA